MSWHFRAPGQVSQDHHEEFGGALREIALPRHRAGTGPELRLVPLTPSHGPDPEECERFTDTLVVTDRSVEVVGVGGDVKGRPGDVVELDLGVHNKGPGRVEKRSWGWEVTPPEGVTVLPPDVAPDPDSEGDGEPVWGCAPLEAGAERYTCAAGTGRLDAGEYDLERFRFRIDEPMSADGTAVQVRVLFDEDYTARAPGGAATRTAPTTANGLGVSRSSADHASGRTRTIWFAAATAGGLLLIAAAARGRLSRAWRRRRG
ncbi:hypothetical protein [Streptomyces sp. MJP52]|uniref:hypothetical protein n=1 Tax=Streptomyces sp. MJP52 TaxID=2940555 RepID=UPI002476F978|nr:hypothetical protein [Streptomyces sp. MJP52]